MDTLPCCSIAGEVCSAVVGVLAVGAVSATACMVGKEIRTVVLSDLQQSQHLYPRGILDGGACELGKQVAMGATTRKQTDAFHSSSSCTVLTCAANTVLVCTAGVVTSATIGRVGHGNNNNNNP